MKRAAGWANRPWGQGSLAGCRVAVLTPQDFGNPFRRIESNQWSAWVGKVSVSSRWCLPN